MLEIISKVASLSGVMAAGCDSIHFDNFRKQCKGEFLIK